MTNVCLHISCDDITSQIHCQAASLIRIPKLKFPKHFKNTWNQWIFSHILFAYVPSDIATTGCSLWREILVCWTMVLHMIERNSERLKLKHSTIGFTLSASLGSVHIERVTLRLRLWVTHRHRYKVPHSIGYQTHFIRVSNYVLHWLGKLNGFHTQLNWVTSHLHLQIT